VGRLFLLFTVVPLIELYLLVSIGRVLGTAPTILLVLLTGAVGAWFARLEGARVIQRWQEAIARQQLPKDGLVDGLLIFVGGVLLITPGVLTDVAGLSMVMPLTRRPIAGMLRRWFERQIASGRVQVYAPGYNGRGPTGPGVIDIEGDVVEVVEVTESSDASPRLEK
jgi:UPF0716 protein FxsA